MALALPTDPRGQRLFVLGFLGVAVAGGYWYTVFEPKRLEIQALRARIVVVEGVNTVAKTEIAKGNSKQVDAATARSRADLATLRTLVPDGAEVSALIDQISNSARRANLDIGTVEPLPVVEGELFDTHRYRMRLTGPYHDLAAVLANIGSLPRIVAPVNLHLTVQNTATTKVTRGKQNLDAIFELQTAVVRTAPPKPKPKPKTAAPAAKVAKAGGG
ncbi:MAG: type 4a pilus biogenesis protein PilO [Gemmatimonadetes bacterium]|nr:type 4a pilus biogenesis protein PilO [Gemmatimonadota bacterium]